MTAIDGIASGMLGGPQLELPDVHILREWIEKYEAGRERRLACGGTRSQDSSASPASYAVGSAMRHKGHPTFQSWGLVRTVPTRRPGPCPHRHATSSERQLACLGHIRTIWIHACDHLEHCQLSSVTSVDKSLDPSLAFPGQ